MAVAQSISIPTPGKVDSFDQSDLIVAFKEREAALERELKQTREALASERNMLRTLMDNLPDFVFIKDKAGHYILSNTAHTSSLGLSSPQEIEGKTVFDFFAKDRAERFASDDNHVLTTGEPIINREEIRSATSQKQRWVLTTKLPLRSPQGEIAGLVCISRDISENKHLEEETRQSQKMEAIGRLAGGIAHDFNNILTSIIGFGELLLNNPALDNLARRDVEEIYSAAIRASALTQQLLAFGRKQATQPVTTNLNEVVERLNLMLRRLVGENISLTTRLVPGPGNVHVDAGQIEQVITNIVVNACDAMTDGGSLTLETGSVVFDQAEAQRRSGVAPGRYVWMSFKDNGAGMPDDVKDRIFEPFFTTKAPGKGTGLGLAASYGIIKQSGGHIDIDSKMGEGTTITFYLPVAQPEAAPKPEPHTESPEGGSETVLLVEDDPSVRKLTASLLVKLGYTVLEAGDGAKAMNVIRECDTQKIDLLLTDVVMPQIGGKRLADNLEVLSPGTRVLFTSGHNEEEILLQGISSHEIAFLPKPFSPMLLAKKIREVLDR